ncbi:AAA family ATPase [Candidatus Berkiella aquae]|uniref:AAA family ATPase n=1 Tax=Candidatus Berkiella aquae TaxID=295108 RepID=A0A0Q9YK82_9GAMM|nr:AAA family ATPase [Candidatus Berkiella aquae]MCS5711245.1 AAA family ATPase [Candidatus Berkiella aquae]
MFFTTVLFALLLAGLLFFCKRHFFKSSDEQKFSTQEIILTLVVSFAFVGAYQLIQFSVAPQGQTTQGSQTVYTKQSYLDPEQQFKIGKAFYLGENLPKDNLQALNWFLLAAQQGHKDSEKFIRMLGYEIEKKPTDESYQETKNNLSVDVIPANKIKTKLSDIAGMSQAKPEIEKYLGFMKNSDKFTKLGAIPPKGILIYGPPGTGKTLLARAIAGEANRTFISVSGSAFEEMFVGKGAARVRELFELARKNKPAIIFIDEIDALAPARNTPEISPSHIQTLNQLLSEMQNLDEEKNADIAVLAATNRIEALDPAILRPGRFDWQIEMKLPLDDDRKAIFEQALKKIVVSNDLNIGNLVIQSAGFTGADIVNLVNEAAIFAAENNKSAVDNESFDLAFKKVSTYEKDANPQFSAKVLASSQLKTNLSEIGGMNEAKREVAEVVDFLKDPKKFTRLGAKPPNGILMYGPPGTGKTLMARAIAGEAKANFIAVSGADFDERYVGVGAARVKELFKLARKYKPCIVFIDEIDALAPQRTGGGDASGRDQTINQFLNEMDNIQNNINEGIIFIGATNRLDIIDSALLRPGRFDRKVFFRLPTIEERASILQSHLQNIVLAPDVEVKTLAKMTIGFSGAELANLVNEAAIDATRNNKKSVDMASFEEANDKLALGVKQDSLSYSEEDKKRTAYHEAGHALVGLLHPNHPRMLHKLTIGLRDYSLGVTHFQPQSEEYSLTKKELEAVIATSFGGYVAEELIYGKDNISVGASSDLKNANRIARDMVSKYGMADKQVLIVNDVFHDEGLFQASAEEIMNRDYKEAKAILEKNMDKLHLLAKTLLEKETLSYDEIVKLLNLK